MICIHEHYSHPIVSLGPESLCNNMYAPLPWRSGSNVPHSNVGTANTHSWLAFQLLQLENCEKVKGTNPCQSPLFKFSQQTTCTYLIIKYTNSFKICQFPLLKSNAQNTLWSGTYHQKSQISFFYYQGKSLYLCYPKYSEMDANIHDTICCNMHTGFNSLL